MDDDERREMNLVLQRFEVLRIETRDAIISLALDHQDAAYEKRVVHRTEFLAARMALLEQYHLEAVSKFASVLDSYVKKGQRGTQRADYPSAAIQSAATDLKAGVTVHKVYRFLSFFTLDELRSVGV